MEETIVNFLIQNSETFSNIGIYVVFFAGLLESLPIFGFFIPGQTLIMLAGFIIKLSEKNILPVLLSAIIGVVLGDIISFYLGKKYGLSYLKNKGSKYISDENITKIKTTLERHLGKTLFLGRLHSLTRSLAPFIAGSSGIKIRKFLPYNIIAGTLWTIILICIGYFVGQSFEILGLVIGKFIFFATLITSIVIALVLYAKKWNFHTKDKNIFLLILSIISIYIFASVGEGIRKGKTILEFNQHLHDKALAFGTSHFDFFYTITNFGEKSVIIIASLLIVAFLYYKKRIRDMFVFSTAMFITILSVLFIKRLVMLDRPTLGLITESGFSFPSGHATLSSCLFILLALIFRHKNKIINTIWIIICILIPVLISASRVFLGVHWFSDVFAGFFFGLSIACLCYLGGLFYPWFFAKIRENKKVPNL